VVQNEFPPPRTQKVIGTHRSQNLLVVYLPTLPPQFSMHATVPVGWPAQRDLLHLAA